LLQNLNERVRLCYERAVEAREHANFLSDPEAKADFLKVEQSWLILAHSYQLGERLNDFVHTKPDPRVSPLQAVLTELADKMRQPLTAIVARAAAAKRFLANSPPEIERARKSLDRIEEAGFRADKVLRGFIESGGHH
jgi:hypothetical protein